MEKVSLVACAICLNKIISFEGITKRVGNSRLFSALYNPIAFFCINCFAKSRRQLTMQSCHTTEYRNKPNLFGFVGVLLLDVLKIEIPRGR